MKQERQKLLAVAVFFTVTLLGTDASHFRGGTINWKSEGGRKVHFYFKLGWTYGNGPGCQQNLIGQLVTNMPNSYWECQSGCPGSPINLQNVNYYCTGANSKQGWEQGRNDFTHTFQSNGPFEVGFSSQAWIGLSNGKGNAAWNVATTVDLRSRSDTGKVNSSPESQSKPMYYVQFDCEVRLRIPVVDSDNDTVRCRWATGNECISVCNALPGAYLDEETCTLNFNTTLAESYIHNGIYAVALIIEDYPKTPMTLGSTRKTPSDVISSVPLQFLLTTIPQNSLCSSAPRFVSTTPKEKEVITVEEGDKLEIELFADNGNDTSSKANVISFQGPITMTQSQVIPDVNRKNTFKATLTWHTKHQDIGDNIVCADVENDKGKSGNPRCFTVKVVPKGCKSSPCKNNGKCIANLGNYTCVCRPGFTGHNCEIDIDDCTSNPCPSGMQCTDGTNSYTCSNQTTTIATTTAKTNRNITFSRCEPEYEDCYCEFKPSHNRYHWMGLSHLARDLFCFFYGFPFGLVLSLFTTLACRHCRSSKYYRRRGGQRQPRSKPGHNR